jgi:exodeoxyribonuclease-5
VLCFWYNRTLFKKGSDMTIELTKEQLDVGEKIIKGIKNRKAITTLGGFAGIGKSTLVRYIKDKLPNFKVCAYTGKAVDVLRRKGIDASTIHSLIYEPVTDKNGNVEFVLKAHLDCDGIVIDEASMISKEIDYDLCSFRIPLIYVGDHGQLPPITGNYNLMEHPEYRLETVHRNAGDIAHFAEHIRKGYEPLTFRKSPQITFSYNIEEVMNSADQVICAFNRTRVEINKKIRKSLGFTELVHNGEKVMCLRNSKRAGIFNGMQGHVRDYSFRHGRLFINFVSNLVNYNLEIDPSAFNKEKVDFSTDPDDPHPFEYAYAATCHKCQGSGFPSICVIEQKCDKWDHIRWSYTAASRAEKHVFWIPADKSKANININDPSIQAIFGL